MSGGLLVSWRRFWFEPVSPSPLCLFRIAFGLLSLLNALLYIPDFLVWFGREGAASVEAVAAYQPTVVARWLAWWKPGDGFYLLLLAAQIVSSVLVTLGLRTKSSLFILWLSRLILYHRNPFLWHQVDILLRYYGLILLVAPSGAMYSLDRWRERQADPRAPVRYFAPWAQRLIQVKLAFIYAEAFLGKIVGPAWQGGTAVYYATHFTDGQRYPVPGLMDHLSVYQALTYFTLVIEFSLVVLVWFRPLRYPVLLGGLAFHLGIHMFINLDLLEFGVLIAYLCHLDPGQAERFVSACRRRLP